MIGDSSRRAVSPARVVHRLGRRATLPCTGLWTAPVDNGGGRLHLMTSHAARVLAEEAAPHELPMPPWAFGVLALAAFALLLAVAWAFRGTAQKHTPAHRAQRPPLDRPGARPRRHDARQGSALSADRRRRLGVMGGTFDPIHHGHLVAASEVQSLFDLDEVIFVPTGQPWQKAERVVSEAEHRYLMTVIATASNPRFQVSRVDVDREGPTYTIDTLRDLRAQHPDDELFFITGADALAQILSWKDVDELWDLAHFIGVTRPGYELSESGLPAGRGHPPGGAGHGDQLHRLP